MVTATEVRTALATVRDPELDESVVELGFVADVAVQDGGVTVRLRLPTYFCAPNFAFLMVADAQDAVGAIPGVQSVAIALEDHHAAEEITAGVASRRGFRQAFSGLADADLDELRATFRRKAFVARQDRVVRALLAEGLAPDGLAGLRLRDLPPGPEAEAYRSRRADLGYDVGPAAPLLLDAWGCPVAAPDVAALLRWGRTTRVSMEGNAGLCRGLLATRYGTGAREGRSEG